jgi:putative FmdB family regulatory protein
MPTYEYECKTCGHVFEAFQSMKDEALKICPECGKEIRRIINGGSGIIFKGSGFYVTDNGGSKKAVSSSSSSAPTTSSDSASPTDAKSTKADSSTPKEKAVG